MAPITYKLDIDGPAAATYYPAVERFTNEVIAKAENSILPFARSYRGYIVEYELEPPRTVEEYTFELLNLGILWRRYGATSIAVEMAPFRLLAFLSEWRKKHQRLKPAIDLLRGALMSFFLVPIEPKRTEIIPCDVNDLHGCIHSECGFLRGTEYFSVSLAGRSFCVSALTSRISLEYGWC